MLTAPKLQAVRALVETVPDITIVGLTNALANTPPGGALGPVREMVEIEAEERAVRNTVLAPITGLCRSGRRVGRLTFPPHVVRRLWLGLKAQSPSLVSRARSTSFEAEFDPPPSSVLDDLCVAAGDGLRARDLPDFIAAAEMCDNAVPGGADTLASCLDLAPVVRGALPFLDGWVRRMDDDDVTQTRLAFRDAVAIAPDAGPRFVEMLAARLEAPWHAMRLISTVMDRPPENFLAGSEMGVFAEDVLADIDAQLEAVRRLDFKRGTPAEARDAGRAACDAILAIGDVEDCVSLSREGRMGARVNEQKKALASLVEAKLGAIDDLVAAALPLESVRFAGRMKKMVPKLSADPAPGLVQRATAALAFAEEVRPATAAGGFGSARGKALEQVNTRLANYTDDLLLHLRAEDAGDLGRARLYLEVAAGFLTLSKDENSAQIVRRRAAA